MKAYTVYQPFADATVAGLKHYETRPRRTSIRGRVAVHAGKKIIKNHDLFAAIHEAQGKDPERYRGSALYYTEHGVGDFGAVVGTVEIVDCVPVEEIADKLTPLERLLGDYTPGRFAYVLKSPVKFDTPVPARGQQGWWQWEMKIKHLNVDRCGECQLIEWCGDPYKDPHFCCDRAFEEIGVEAYIRMAESSTKGSRLAISKDVLRRFQKAGEKA